MIISKHAEAIQELMRRWSDGYPFDEDSESDIDLRARAESELEGPLFASDGSEEQRWIEDEKNACPHCGGSGHKDDVRAEAALAEALEVIRPFARYMDGGLDLDDKGNPLPDEDAVGWVYLTNAEFRAARTFMEKHNGN